MTFRDSALKRDAVLQALPTDPQRAVKTGDLDRNLGFATRAHLEALCVRRQVERRQTDTPRSAWLWWRL